MSPEILSEIHDLRERVTRLEHKQERPRGRCTQAGAARYLGISEETLRLRHLRGLGPRRTPDGRRWSYSYADLDAYAEQHVA
jgi:hypothetical protein